MNVKKGREAIVAVLRFINLYVGATIKPMVILAKQNAVGLQTIEKGNVRSEWD